MSSQPYNALKLSRFLSLILRHAPESIGLELDSQGWAKISQLLPLLKKRGFNLSFNELASIVQSNNKQRFIISEDKQKIRANQGHSIPIDLGYAEQKPPAILLHGTATRFIESIFQQGLTKQKRHHVHLSTDLSTAVSVGKRYGKAVILCIDAQTMYEHGYRFYLSTNGVWLTEQVPVDYISYYDAR